MEHLTLILGRRYSAGVAPWFCFPHFIGNLTRSYFKQTQNRIDAMLHNSILYKEFGLNSGIYFYSEKFIPN